MAGYPYHCIWIGSNLSKHHKLCLLSLLKTNPNAHIIWWTLTGYTENITTFLINNQLESHVEVREFVLSDQIRGTPFEHNEHRLFKHGVVLSTDEMRVVILYNYGGFYFDFDVLFLKDMSELMADGSEFVYRWEMQPCANNAIIHIKRGSSIATSIMQRMLDINSPYAQNVYTLEFANSIGLRVMPCELFDAGWFNECDDRIKPENFFEPNTLNICEFCPESYAYHWHNRWNAVMHPDSIAARFLTYFENLM